MTQRDPLFIIAGTDKAARDYAWLNHMDRRYYRIITREDQLLGARAFRYVILPGVHPRMRDIAEERGTLDAAR